MKRKIYIINAFAKNINGGNLAGIVFDGDDLTEKQMRKMAKDLGYSETAFVLSSNIADYKVRFFTPNEEIDLCGHATIGTFYAMNELGKIQTGKYIQETKAGVFGIEIMRDNSVMMNQPIPIFSDVILKDEIAETLNIARDLIREDVPIQIVSTGIRDIIVPIKNLDYLYAIKPDFDKIKDLSQKYNAVGYHVFTMETVNEGTAHCRNFAPLYDIPEEAATGTSNGALGCYLYKYGLVEGNKDISMIMEQGYSMNKPSEILVNLSVDNDEFLEVRVGGSALNLRETEIDI